MQSRTKVMHKTLKPQWNEELHVLVQEPTTQLLRVEMFDHDLFNPKASPKIPLETTGHCRSFSLVLRVGLRAELGPQLGTKLRCERAPNSRTPTSRIERPCVIRVTMPSMPHGPCR